MPPADIFHMNDIPGYHAAAKADIMPVLLPRLQNNNQYRGHCGSFFKSYQDNLQAAKMSSPALTAAEIGKDAKPADRASIEAGEDVETTAEYERYLRLHQEFAVANGAQHRKLLRKRKSHDPD